MKFIFTTLILLSTFNVWAQEDAKALLDKAAKKIKDYKAIEILFDVTMENKEENINESHSGKAYMKGNLYRLNLMGVESYFDGKAIYSYMPDIEEVNIKDPSEDEEEFLNPTTIFEIHNQGFKQNIQKKEGNIAYIDLIPEKDDKSFSKLVIKLNTATNTIEQVTSYGKDNNNVHIKIKSLQEMTPIPADGFFKFDKAKFPNVEVIDLRD
ncbi:MAG: LolA family protein [Marinifilaceae bacterium]